MHLYFASHLGTLDAPCEGHDVGAEPEDGVWCIYPEDGRTLECMPRVEMLMVQANYTDFVLDHRQAPEHSKSPILSHKFTWV
jgi:hypothetical protein